MKRILTIIILLFLCSCSISNKLTKIPNTNQQPKVPKALLEKCPEIKHLVGDSLGDLYKHDSDLMIQYTECAKSKDLLIKSVE